VGSEIEIPQAEAGRVALSPDEQSIAVATASAWYSPPRGLINWFGGAPLQTVEPSYESSAAESLSLPSRPAYLSPAFLNAEPLSMNFRC
jgi:hypothetical protein